MRFVKICRQKGKFIVMVRADGYIRKYACFLLTMPSKEEGGYAIFFMFDNNFTLWAQMLVGFIFCLLAGISCNMWKM